MAVEQHLFKRGEYLDQCAKEISRTAILLRHGVGAGQTMHVVVSCAKPVTDPIHTRWCTYGPGCKCANAHQVDGEAVADPCCENTCPV